MSTGDPRSVCLLYKVLRGYDDTTGISRSAIREQLYREYGVQVNDGDRVKDYSGIHSGLMDAKLEEVFTFLASTDEESL